MQIDCYRRAEEGIRAKLNSWAAWLETIESNPNHVWLMQHMISTRQLITIRRDDPGEDGQTRRFFHWLANELAEKTEGVYQVDGQGFFVM